MDGGFISPTVAAHGQKNAMHSVETNSNSKVLPAAQVGGGIISPAGKKHVASVTMGNGWINPNIARHIAQSAKVTMGAGLIHPNISKHLQAQ